MQKFSPQLRTGPAEKLLLYSILTIIALAPLPFGSDRPLPIAIITLVTGLLGTCWGVFAAGDRNFVRISLQRLRWPALFVLLMFIWAVVQVMPLDIAGLGSSFWEPLKQLLPQENIRATVSVNSHDAWLAMFKMLAYTMIFWLVAQLARSGNNAAKILQAIAWSGAVYAAYGLLAHLVGSNKILWYDKTAYIESVTSTFINRNNYATYTGMVLLVSLGLFFHGLFKSFGQLSRRACAKLLLQRLFSTSLPLLGAIFLLMTALLLSGSRAGIGCTFLAVIILVLLYNFTAQMRLYRTIFAGLSATILLLLLLLVMAGSGLAVSRLQGMAGDAAYRGSIYNITVEALKDFPLQGTGLGSFTAIFNAYRDNSMAGLGDTLTDHAHNSYLELMLELGIPAAVLLFLAFGVIGLKCLFGVWRRQKNAHIPALAVAGAALVAAHALVDFSAQIPAVAIIFIVLLAVGWAQSYSQQIDLSDASCDLNTPPIYYIIATKAAVTIGIILTIAGLWQVYTVYSGTKTASGYKDIAYNEIEQARAAGVLTEDGVKQLTSARQHLRQSLRLAPIDAYSWAYLAYATLLLEGDRQAAAKLLATSIANGYYQTRLVLFRARIIPVLMAYASEDEQQLFAGQLKLARQLESAAQLD